MIKKVLNELLEEPKPKVGKCTTHTCSKVKPYIRDKNQCGCVLLRCAECCGFIRVEK